MKKEVFLAALVVFLAMIANNALAGCQLAENMTELTCGDITLDMLCTSGGCAWDSSCGGTIDPSFADCTVIPNSDGCMATSGVCEWVGEEEITVVIYEPQEGQAITGPFNFSYEINMPAGITARIQMNRVHLTTLM